MGYSDFQKGYKLYDMKSKKFFVSRDVIFHEQIQDLYFLLTQVL